MVWHNCIDFAVSTFNRKMLLCERLRLFTPQTLCAKPLNYYGIDINIFTTYAYSAAHISFFTESNSLFFADVFHSINTYILLCFSYLFLILFPKVATTDKSGGVHDWIFRRFWLHPIFAIG